ncbi:MAG: DUF3857 domain-containing protein [Candidatus Coatesbacteria bacterium]|nr:MAG: DUF3857 domain-containing protein [Candidatus Coatesbacteria bacterium]
MNPKLLTTVAAITILGTAYAAPAAAFHYESPAAALARAERAPEPASDAAAEAWADAGWYALFADNDYARAREYFEEALARDPALPRALEGYGRSVEIGGDYDEALRAYLDFLVAAPDHPAAPIYLYRCHLLEEDTNGREYFITTLQALREAEAAPPLLRAKAAQFLFDRYHRAGEFEEAEALLAPLHFVRTWRFIGPFDNEGKEGFDAAYPPETEFSPTAQYDGKARPVGWRALPVPLPTGYLDFTTVLTPADKSVAYAAVAVKSPTARETYLALAAAGAVKVWLNGAEIFAREAYHEGYFDQYLAPAPLQAGYNFLLVKVCGDDTRWGFGARLLSEGREPLRDVEFDPSTEALAAAARTSPRSPSVRAEPERFFDARLLTEPPDAFDFYYASLEHYARSDADEKEEVPTKLMLGAQALLPAADFYYYVGVMEKEESRRRANLARALELAPGHNQARLAWGKYFYNLDRPYEAEAALEEVLVRNPGFVEAYQYWAKIMWENGYAYDAVREAADLSRRYPSYPYSRMIEALFEENYGDLDRAADLWEAIFNADRYSTTARDELFTLLLNRGETDAAAAVLRRALEADPYDGDVRIKLAEALDHQGRHEEARAEAEIGLTFCPEDHELWRLKGIALEKLGREAEARAAYRRAVELKRNFPALENYLRYLEPEEETLRAPRLDAYELIAAYPGDEAFPRDSAVWLLHDRQVEVFENGTSSRSVHYVVKILTAEGADKFRYVNISYSPGSETIELKRAAVLKPDGTEIAAAQIREHNVFDVGSRLYYSYVNREITMPNLAPGDTVEVSYKINDTGENLFADYFGDFFYFGGNNSTRHARYVITVPAGKKYYFHRLRGAPAPTVTRGTDNTTYRFDMYDLPPAEEEPYMPALAEILPSVQVSTFATWDDVGRWYNGLIKDVFRPSPEIETLAAELTADDPDDLTKLQRVYNLVMSRIRYVGLEFGIGGYRPHSPKQCLEAHYGDCKDKSTLMNTLYRLMGWKAYPALVRTADLGELDYELPLLGLFNHMISYVELPNGEKYFLDGTAEYHSYRELPTLDQNLDAFVVFDEGGEFLRTPTLTLADNHLRTRTTFVLQSNGDAHVHRSVEYGAADAPYQRERFQVEEKRKAVIEEYWNGLYPGTKVFNEKFSDISDYSRRVRTEYDALARGVFDAGAPRVHLDAVIHKAALLTRYGKKASRTWPLIIRKNTKTTAELTYVLPAGYVVTALPLAKEFRSPYGAMKIDVRQGEGRVTVKQEFELYAQRISPAAYAGFREFCLNIDDWENEPIILEKRP